MAIIKSEAYLLRKIPFRETSWLVTCLTSERGKIKGIVKGVRKLKNPLLSAFELLTHLEIVFYEKVKSNLYLVSNVSILHAHEKIRKSFASLTYGSYFAELIDTLIDEHDPQPLVFELLGSAVSGLEKAGPSFDMLARAFEFKLLESVGLSPHLNECVKCTTPDMRKIYFSVAQGGVFCEKCHAGCDGGFLISKDTVATINFFLHSNLDQSMKYGPTRQVFEELHQISKRFIERRIEKQLKGLHFIDEVKRSNLTPNLAKNLI